MMTREEMLKQLEFNEMSSISYRLNQELIHLCFDSIGSCDECISRAEDNHCEIYESMVTEDDWYCADFTRKEE